MAKIPACKYIYIYIKDTYMNKYVGLYVYVYICITNIYRWPRSLHINI